MPFPQTMPSAEPFFLPASRTGCLLVHGLTGTPKEMRWMGDYLHANQISVLGVRLAGHATLPDDLQRSRWTDWLASVEDGYHLLRNCCNRVFLCGLSLGGVLALFSASFLPVRGVIAMSSPYELPADWRLNFARLLRYVQPRVEKGAPDWRNPDAAADHIAYPYYPTAAIAELRDLLREFRAVLPRVTAPALLAHSRHDRGVVPANMEKIHAALGSADKQMLWIENSGHVIPREPQREAVFAAALDFIRRHSL
ncbi:MAG: alpha/beta fold hydrolase [Chloroflexota bacterium]